MKKNTVKKVIQFIVVMIFFTTLTSCQDSYLPKPKAYLSLEYTKAVYEKRASDCGFTFDGNQQSSISYPNIKSSNQEMCSMSIHYPKWNANLYLSYSTIDQNLVKLLKDAQKIPEQHIVKADEIVSTVYENTKNKTYGMFYEVIGNAASTHQFYLTDSTKHFLLGSLYFNRKPNYDSIFPAAKYLEKDLKRFIESLVWKS